MEERKVKLLVLADTQTAEGIKPHATQAGFNDDDMFVINTRKEALRLVQLDQHVRLVVASDVPEDGQLLAWALNKLSKQNCRVIALVHDSSGLDRGSLIANGATDVIVVEYALAFLAHVLRNWREYHS